MHGWKIINERQNRRRGKKKFMRVNAVIIGCGKIAEKHKNIYLLTLSLSKTTRNCNIFLLNFSNRLIIHTRIEVLNHLKIEF